LKRILLTGASGFLGRYVLKKKPADAEILAQFYSQPFSETISNTKIIKLDLLSSDWKAMQNFNPDCIIHTAALTSVDKCEKKRELAKEINFEATRRLLEFAERNNSRFIFTSTDMVFDGKKGNYTESDPADPVNHYGKTKATAENYILQNYRNSVVLRVSLLYGVANNSRPSFTQKMLENLQNEKEIYAFTDQIRNPLLVSSLARAIWGLVDMDFTGMLNIGGSQSLSRYEMAMTLCRQFKLNEELIVPVPSNTTPKMAPRPTNCSMNISLAQSLLKTDLVGFEEGLSEAF
jgi:dTDP-4-dehydrorhamnose reductase